MELRPLTQDINPIVSQLEDAQKKIQELTVEKTSLASRTSLLENDVKKLSEALDALSARLDKAPQ
ncbi:hypothetical protein IVA79_34730 [Bradyrhizobium sp. 138]|uniref:hypothetical protein n=1 Tax=Bradyrhizobium sp. 138 TaxID=2782615 RepID=UPI001FF82DCE|nr:hypothetical protein [Bradyrhizobium sp. 138]MCK1738989.1 hypothetical protein [Bradyrhizobium sp. 138]